jgi:hypothetical protein
MLRTRRLVGWIGFMPDSQSPGLAAASSCFTSPMLRNTPQVNRRSALLGWHSEATPLPRVFGWQHVCGTEPSNVALNEQEGRLTIGATADRRIIANALISARS